MGKGRNFSLFDLVSSSHQFTIDKDTIPLIVFCTPGRLFEWLAMPQGSSAAPGWFVKVFDEVIEGLKPVTVFTLMISSSTILAPPPTPTPEPFSNAFETQP